MQAPLSRNCILNLKDKKTLRNLNAVVREVKVSAIVSQKEGMITGDLEISAVFQHPHILPVLDVEYVQDTEHVTVTQFGQGASLRDLVYQEVSPPSNTG